MRCIRQSCRDLVDSLRARRTRPSIRRLSIAMLLLLGVAGCSSGTGTPSRTYRSMKRAEKILAEQASKPSRKWSVRSWRNCRRFTYTALLAEQIDGYDWSGRLRKPGYCRNPAVGEALAARLDRDAPYVATPAGERMRTEGQTCGTDIDCTHELACLGLRCRALSLAGESLSRCSSDEDCGAQHVCRLRTCVTQADWEAEKARY